MAGENINPKVDQVLADMDGARVQQRSLLDYFHHFWESLKDHHRFMLIGVAILVPLGVLVGFAFAPFLAGAMGGFAPAATLMVPVCTAISLVFAEGFGFTGVAAASRASGLAEKHARILDADAQGKDTLAATDDLLMYNGKAHHYEFPTGRDKGKLFSLKSGAVFSVIGAVLGGMLGWGIGVGGSGVMEQLPVIAPIVTALAKTHLVGVLATALSVTPAVAGVIAASAIVIGAFGLVMGVDRNVLKSFFNQTDANDQGKLRHVDGPDLGRQQSKESDHDLEQHRLRRQEEISRLKTAYTRRIFWSTLTARFKGFGGVLPSAVIGGAIGAVAAGGLLLAGISLPILIPLFAAGLGMYGMNVSAQAATEAGAEAAARAIDNEFEHNRALRAKGITPQPAREDKGSLFSLKSALLMGAVGAIAGVMLTSTIGAGFVALGAFTKIAALAHLSVGMQTSLSVLTCGLFGVTYGLGTRTLDAVAAPANWIYDKFAFGHTDPKPELAPAQQQAPVQGTAHNKISEEEAALLAQKLEAGNGKNFVQATQQLQSAPAGVGV